MRFLRPELGVGLLLAACGGQGAAVLASTPAALAPLAGFALPSDPTRPLLGYSWEGEGFVSALEGSPALVTAGEIGRTPATRLYLRGEDLERELAQERGWVLEESRELGRASGRHGQGLELGRGSRLVLAPVPGEAGGSEGWSVELWLKPPALQTGVLFALVGAFEVSTEAGGRVVVTTKVQGSDGPRTVVAKSPDNLLPGEWNHLGVVLDTGIVQHLRVVLNGRARSERLDGQGATRFERLALGSPSAAHQTFPALVDELRLQARVANSSEFEAHWRGRSAPLERLTLLHGDGSERQEFWTRALEQPRLEPGADWSLGELRHVRADEGGLSWTPADWQRVPALDPPLARTTAPVVEVGDETLFVFSGEVRDSHYGRAVNSPDTWLFDMRAGSWERVETPLSPRGRCHQPAAYSPEHDVVMMLGGWDNNSMPGELLDDLWLFHVRERRWEQRVPSYLPGKLSDSVVVYHPGRKVFVVLAGLWVYTYDPARNHFATEGKLRPVGLEDPAAYEPLNGPIAALDPRTNLVWLFGGARKAGEGEVFSDELASFDLETRALVFHDVPRPAARVRGALAWDPRSARFVLFGGVREQGSQRFDDLWTFDPDALRWQQQPYSGAITRRGGYYGMGYSSEQQRFFLLTGRHTRERFLEESWTLALDAAAEGRARYLFDRAAFPGEAAWFLEAEAGDGRIEARFRASDDGRAFGPELATCPPTGRYVEVDLRLAPGPSGVAPRVRALGFRAPQ